MSVIARAHDPQQRVRVLSTMDIGVVGGGASAVCLLDALSRLDTPIGRITVFDPAEHPWTGRPYAPDLPTVRVNAVPADMSVVAGDPGHLDRWLRAAGIDAVDPWIDTPFAPRAVYGRYLQESAADAVRRLRAKGWEVQLERTAVVAALRTADRVVLRTQQGRHRAVDHAVLCVGVGRPADGYRLGGAAGFIADPYPLAGTLRDIPPGAEVIVLGSGLTAIDVVLSLLALGHRGGIRLASRTGLLPGVRQRPTELTLREFTPRRLRARAAERGGANLAELAELMRRELAAQGQEPGTVWREISALGQEPGVERLRRHFAEVDSPDLGLRILQLAVPEAGPDAWPLLPDADKAAVLRSHYRAIMSLCCPMPPMTAAALLAGIDSGQVTVRSGARQLRQVPGGFELEWDGGSAVRPGSSGSRPRSRRGRTRSGTDRAQVVVNAVSPPSHRIPPAARSLVDSLIGSRAAAANPYGGLHVERATSRLIGGAAADPRLHALGDLAAGSLFFTFGIPSLVDRAVDIAAAMVAHAQDPWQASAPRRRPR